MMKFIELPALEHTGGMPLEEAIAARRSKRHFKDIPLTIDQISRLFWAGQGITGTHGGFEVRASPSPGALFPAELYLVSADHLLRYLPEGHRAEVVRDGDLREELSRACLDQPFVAEAPASLVICMVYERVTETYGERGIRYCHIEAGHIAQNIQLEAVSLGLMSVPVGAFDDEKVKSLLGLPADHDPLYIVTVGQRKLPV